MRLTHQPIRVITFLVAAFDESGRPISGLTAQNFSVTSNSSGIPISSVQTVTDAQIGIASLLVVDTSGSMSGAPISAARQAAGLFVDSLKRGDQLGLIAFDTNVEIVARSRRIVRRSSRASRASRPRATRRPRKPGRCDRSFLTRGGCYLTSLIEGLLGEARFLPPVVAGDTSTLATPVVAGGTSTLTVTLLQDVRVLAVAQSLPGEAVPSADSKPELGAAIRGEADPKAATVTLEIHASAGTATRDGGSTWDAAAGAPPLW